MAELSPELNARSALWALCCAGVLVLWGGAGTEAAIIDCADIVCEVGAGSTDTFRFGFGDGLGEKGKIDFDFESPPAFSFAVDPVALDPHSLLFHDAAETFGCVQYFASESAPCVFYDIDASTSDVGFYSVSIAWLSPAPTAATVVKWDVFEPNEGEGSPEGPTVLDSEYIIDIIDPRVRGRGFGFSGFSVGSNTVPEAGTLGLVVLGMAGGVAWRLVRRRPTPSSGS